MFDTYLVSWTASRCSSGSLYLLGLGRAHDQYACPIQRVLDAVLQKMRARWVGLPKSHATTWEPSSYCIIIKQSSCRTANPVDFSAIATVLLTDSIFVHLVLTLPLCLRSMLDEPLFQVEDDHIDWMIIKGKGYPTNIPYFLFLQGIVSQTRWILVGSAVGRFVMQGSVCRRCSSISACTA